MSILLKPKLPWKEKVPVTLKKNPLFTPLSASHSPESDDTSSWWNLTMGEEWQREWLPWQRSIPQQQIDHMGVGGVQDVHCVIQCMWVCSILGNTMRFFCSNLLILLIKLPIVQYFKISMT